MRSPERENPIKMREKYDETKMVDFLFFFNMGHLTGFHLFRICFEYDFMISS